MAVLIDATIIRGVLLPASMKLLGDWNWYLPGWLQWLPHVGTEGVLVRPAEHEERPDVDAPDAEEDSTPTPVPA